MNHPTCASMVKLIAFWWIVFGSFAFAQQESPRGETIGSGNLHFLPGDAFFSAAVSAQDAEAFLEPTRSLEFEYRLPKDALLFGGKLGFDRARINDAPLKLRQSLSSGYTWLRKGNPRELLEVDSETGETLEMNPVIVLIYPDSFDPDKFQFGLKYNEQWSDPKMQFGYTPFGRGGRISGYKPVP